LRGSLGVTTKKENHEPQLKNRRKGGGGIGEDGGRNCPTKMDGDCREGQLELKEKKREKGGETRSRVRGNTDVIIKEFKGGIQG